MATWENRLFWLTLVATASFVLGVMWSDATWAYQLRQAFR
jgi:hypothetical protein